VTGPLGEQRPPGKDEIVRNVKAERRRTLRLLRSLEPAAWETPTALPGWRIREVAAHLITTDRAAVSGSMLPLVFTSTDRLERWNERVVPKWAGRPISELLIGLERWGRRFARLASAIPSAALRVRVPSAWGRVPVAMMIQVRVYDEWIHRQDVRRALGRPDEDVDVEPSAEFLLAALGTDTVPKLSDARGRIRVRLSGLPLPEWGWELGEGSTNEVRIQAPAPAFVMAAAGRGSFDELRSEGVLTLEGDEPLGQRFLSKLRIV
jgi:uncharacterized protein (TIGR03083 family)